MTTAGKFMVRNFPDTRFGHSCCYDSFKPRLIIILIILDFILSISFFMLYISYNLSNWSHDWQQISLELGKFLQKNTKLHFLSFFTFKERGSYNPYPFMVFENYETLRLIFKHCGLGVAFLIPTWSSIKLLLLPKLLTDVYGKVCSRNIDGVAPGWTKTANFETII